MRGAFAGRDGERVLEDAERVFEALDCVGKQAVDLLPSDAQRRALPAPASPIAMQDTGDGNCWLRINQAVNWTTAMQIMQLLKGDAHGTQPLADVRGRGAA